MQIVATIPQYWWVAVIVLVASFAIGHICLGVANKKLREDEINNSDISRVYVHIYDAMMILVLLSIIELVVMGIIAIMI
jgi:hypothetical protein